MNKHLNPAEIAAATASPVKKTSKRSIPKPQPTSDAPLAGTNSADGHYTPENHDVFAIDGTVISTGGHNAAATHARSAVSADTIADIVEFHRLRQGVIRAKTRLINQGKSVIRRRVGTVDEMSSFGDDEAAKATRDKLDRRVTSVYNAAASDPLHEFHGHILPYILAQVPFDTQQKQYEKQLVASVKKLPIYAWAKEIKGLGDVSLATIIGECGDIGSYKSVSAVWKRMGLAVMNGSRQGNPGEGATKDDWIAHGYNRSRRSVSWNARNGIIGGMGLWRPLYGDDVRANPDLTYYQCVFAERARYEAQRLPHKDGTPIKESDKGKESYSKHCAARAFRYTEKRLMKHMYLQWRGLARQD